jgi:hypothetical protein
MENNTPETIEESLKFIRMVKEEIG